MADDDIVTVGGPERASRRGPDTEEAIESLFHACYPRLVYTAFSLVDDWDLAEQLAQEAYLRLWRRWRWIADSRAAPMYLQRTVVNLSRETIGRRVIERRGLRFKGMDRPTEQPTRPVDTSRAWREFLQRRSRASKNRHTGLTAALAVTAVVAIIVAARAGGLFGVTPHGRSAGLIDGSARIRVYPGAIVARIPVSGVVSLVADGPSVWVVHAYGQVGVSLSYQLVKIDERTNKVTLAVNLRYLPGSVAASAGMLWLTTGQGRARGQLVRLDPATGRVIATVHLATGPCDLVTFSLGSLWATCSEGVFGTEFLRLDPGTGQVTGRAGPVRAVVGSIAAAPGGIWFGVPFSPRSGIVRLGHPHGQLITLRLPDRPVNYGGPQPMVYGQGFAWVLSPDESVAKIDPVTGRVLRFYTYRAYDSGHAGGLDYVAVGNGSLWFLDDGYPFSGVLRVSVATGRPLGAVAAPRSGDCGATPCSQIYSTPGAIWVPTAVSLIRIDPARLPR